MITIPKFEYFQFSAKLLTERELNVLPTKRLLAYYKARRTIRYTWSGAITYGGECPEYLDDDTDPAVQDHNALKTYLAEVRKLLDAREHVEKKDRR